MTKFPGPESPKSIRNKSTIGGAHLQHICKHPTKFHGSTKQVCTLIPRSPDIHHIITRIALCETRRKRGQNEEYFHCLKAFQTGRRTET